MRTFIPFDFTEPLPPIRFRNRKMARDRWSSLVSRVTSLDLDLPDLRCPFLLVASAVNQLTRRRFNDRRVALPAFGDQCPRRPRLTSTIDADPIAPIPSAVLLQNHEDFGR